MFRDLRVHRSSRAATLALLTAFLVLVGADPAFATPAGTAMPWDTPLTNLLNNLQGTVARIAITVAIVLTGLIFALGALAFMTALGWVGAAF
jgi:type IV secretory pathway VirB2 component (pilin)